MYNQQRLHQMATQQSVMVFEAKSLFTTKPDYFCNFL